ncbi:hypothetical protein NQ317_014405 [Molorchus minor]|uniref:Uncharacterized protein n=1 Tax=Molorchus minor TaxID=1323400 RepID=A0ABQ9K6U1_9CUCU|nr:hypothetical protein NQ317_014405 [Molorchus minor]
MPVRGVNCWEKSCTPFRISGISLVFQVFHKYLMYFASTSSILRYFGSTSSHMYTIFHSNSPLMPVAYDNIDGKKDVNMRWKL